MWLYKNYQPQEDLWEAKDPHDLLQEQTPRRLGHSGLLSTVAWPVRHHRAKHSGRARQDGALPFGATQPAAGPV